MLFVVFNCICTVHLTICASSSLLAGITDTQLKRLQSVQNKCGPFSVWSTTAGPRHSSPTQPPLASGAAKDLFQDCGPSMEMHPWCRTSISARSLRAGGESSRTFSTPVGIDWMCRPATSTDVGGPAQLRLLRAHSVGTVCHQHCVTAACHWTRSRGGWRLICLDSHECHPAPLWHFVILAPVINVMTYLLKCSEVAETTSVLSLYNTFIFCLFGWFLHVSLLVGIVL